MNDEAPIRKFTWFGWLCFTVFFILSFPWLVSGKFIVCGTTGTMMKLLINSRELTNGVKLYASKHQGKSPHTLRELETEMLLDRSLDKILSHPIERPEKPLGWIYLPDLSDNTPPDYPVLFTPILLDDTGEIIRKFRDLLSKPALFPKIPTRIVSFYNGSSEIMREPEFQALLKKHDITLPATEPMKNP